VSDEQALRRILDICQNHRFRFEADGIEGLQAAFDEIAQIAVEALNS
jgi:hypothetical protein